MDEAMHPLTLMVVGLYGHTLPNQDGAPLRLVVPWKYGFKCIKSIVKINFMDASRATAWNDSGAERIRLLCERESEGGSSALEPGNRAPHWRSFFAPVDPRCRSTATPIRSRTSTKAWT